MKTELLTAALDRALEADIGIAIETNNPRALIMALTQQVKFNSAWSCLIICLPSIEGHVFIVHKSVELD